MNDKAAKVAEQIGVAVPAGAAPGTTTETVAKFTKQLSGLANQFMVNECSHEDQREYFANQAKILKMKQEKEILEEDMQRIKNRMGGDNEDATGEESDADSSSDSD